MTLSLAARGAHWGDRTAVVDISEARRDAPAETVSPTRYSYADLAAFAARFETALADRGIDAGDTVCVISRNRVRVLALVFACRRLGATVAPLSHRLTPATVSEPLEALEPALVATETAQRDLTREVPSAKTATFDDLEDDVDLDFDPDAESDDLEFDLERALESGSVGSTADPERPDDAPLVTLHDTPGPAETDAESDADPDLHPDSIVSFSADAVEATCRSVATTWGLGRSDCTPLVLPLSAPDGLLRVALPILYAGGTLLLDRAFDPGDTLAALEHAPVTVLAGRTAELRDLAENDDADALAALEWVVADSGVPRDVENAFRERGVRVVRAYGHPACPTLLAQPVGRELEADGDDAGDVGYPLFDCDVRLVEDEAEEEGGDEDENETPSVVDGAGEGTLEIAGPTVADATRSERGDGAESEVGDRARTRTRTRDDWFSTGDRFRRDENGAYVPVDLESGDGW